MNVIIYFWDELSVVSFHFVFFFIGLCCVDSYTNNRIHENWNIWFILNDILLEASLIYLHTSLYIRFPSEIFSLNWKMIYRSLVTACWSPVLFFLLFCFLLYICHSKLNLSVILHLFTAYMYICCCPIFFCLMERCEFAKKRNQMSIEKPNQMFKKRSCCTLTDHNICSIYEILHVVAMFKWIQIADNAVHM